LHGSLAHLKQLEIIVRPNDNLISIRKVNASSSTFTRRERQGEVRLTIARESQNVKTETGLVSVNEPATLLNGEADYNAILVVDDY
jgi:cobalamin biosynthesis protein CbiG